MIESLSVPDDGLIAEFAGVDGIAPAVLVFSGSAVGASGLPNELHEIPLEYFHRALAWLRAQPTVDPARVFLMARSRGTEAAQLVALQWPGEVAGLVLGVPSYVVVQAWPRYGAAWTLRGEVVPFHPDGWPTNDFPVDAPAAIPLEDFPGPVLLASGGHDSVWPSSEFAKVIKARRDGQARVTELWDYPDAGHGVGRLLNGGDIGDPIDTAARDVLWPRVVEFLRRHSG